MAKKSGSKNLQRRPMMDESMDTDREEVSSRRSGNSRGGNTSSNRYDRDYKEILKEFVASPAFRYAAGGIATALLSRLANNMSGKYPEISNFIRNNLDTVESKFSMGQDQDNFQH